MERLAVGSLSPSGMQGQFKLNSAGSFPDGPTNRDLSYNLVPDLPLMTHSQGVLLFFPFTWCDTARWTILLADPPMLELDCF